MIKEYTIKETIQELGISKATLYYRINKLKTKLNKHISTKNGKKYISIVGIEILKANECLDEDLNGLDENSDSLDNENIDIDGFEILRRENEFLRNQILEKDSQIQTLSKLVENGQVLLKQEQQSRLLLSPVVKKNKFENFIFKLFKLKD